jgi:serine phosphatase RsbU (regulator of sigma subunit)
MTMSIDQAEREHSLQCMEIWGGFEPVERAVATPGLNLWVFSQPYRGEEQGGDVHYVTLCGGGVITRIVVADVAGHGASVAAFSSSLRGLLRKNINQKSQKRLVGQVNRQFAAMAGAQRFATAIVTTYLASTDRMSICNAGHPSPLYFRAADSHWSLISKRDGSDAGLANLPLGLDDETSYPSVELPLGRGDIIVFYTDALIEAADHEGRLLGESGLLETVRRLELDDQPPASIGGALLAAVANHRQGQPAADDVTLVVVRHTAGPSPRLTLAQKVDVYAKVFGLRSV